MKNNINKLQKDIQEFYDYLMNIWRNNEYYEKRFNTEELIAYILNQYYEHFRIYE